MEESPPISFELLHLISVLSNRIDIVFERCNLSSSQMYTLVYLQSFGVPYKQDQKIILRDRFTKILKQTFNCNKDQVSDLLKEMYDDGLIGDFSISKEEMQETLGLSSGRTRVLSIKRKGVRKVAEFGDELRKLHFELTQHGSKLLCPPESDSPGPLGMAITFFLAAQAEPVVQKNTTR